MFRIVEQPRPCSYLPARQAALEITFSPTVSAADYGQLLRRGYRRFGFQLFRPRCPSCRDCISLRVLAADFIPTAGQRRVLKQNQNVRCELSPAQVSVKHVDLYNRYQEFMHLERGWERQSHTLDSYWTSFVAGPSQIGWEWRYFQTLGGVEKLVGVSLMDRAPGAISLVYFFYDPEWRPRSPGQFSILNQIRYAQREAIPHVYLGYWVEHCQSLNYKNRFHPHEILQTIVDPNQEPTWAKEAT